MPQELIYQPQISPGGTAGTPQAGPDAFGAGIGRGIEALGGSLVRAREAEKERDRQDQSAAAAKSSAAARIDMGRLMDTYEVEGVPGGATMSAEVERVWTGRQQSILDGITDAKIRRAYADHLDSYRVTLFDKASAIDQGQRVKTMVANFKAADDASANRLNDPKATPATLGEELDAFHAEIEATPMSDALRDQRRREGVAARAYAFGLGKADSDPGALSALLESPIFKGRLTDAQYDQLRNEASVGLRRIEAEQARDAAAAKTEARDAINVFQKLLTDGVPVDDAEIGRMQTIARATGLEGEVYDLGKARIVNNENRVAQGMTPAQIDGRIKALDAAIAKAGDKARPADVIAANHLRALLPQRTAEIRNDPLSWGARNGMAIAPVNWGDPASIDARLKAARVVAGQTGSPLRVLTDEEATAMAGEMASGSPQSRLAVANRLAALGPAGALPAIRQVAPGDAVMERAVTLWPAYRASVFRGAELLKANAAIAPRAEVQDAFAARTGRALAPLGAGFGVATIETAKAIYAALAADQGKSEFDEDLFGNALHRALGGDWSNGVRRGGIGDYRGGRIMLPTSMPQAEFDRRIARVGNFNGMVNPDGSRADTAIVKRNFRPVVVRDGVYRWENDQGAVMLKADGKPWLLDIRRVGN